jgi:nucleotide-binding universal stress UspA family protein
MRRSFAARGWWLSRPGTYRTTTTDRWLHPRSPSVSEKVFGKELAHRLENAVERLRQKAGELEIESRLREGPPAGVLTEEAAGAQLLVVGSLGLGGFRELLLGSVSRQCAQHAPCPVLIVPLGRLASSS